MIDLTNLFLSVTIAPANWQFWGVQLFNQRSKFNGLHVQLGPLLIVASW